MERGLDIRLSFASGVEKCGSSAFFQRFPSLCPMTSRQLLHRFLPLIFWALFNGVLDAEQLVPAQRPNFLFMVADDLAARLGCYGDPAAKTPNLDKLASEGVLFNRAYCQGAVCTPSRTSFMLGLNNRHAHPNHFIQKPDTMTMGRWMREHGYQTCAIGKLDHDDPLDRYVDPKAWDVRVKREDMKPKARMPAFTSLGEDSGLRREKLSLIGVSESPEAVTDWARSERALEFLRSERDPQKPFFLAVGFHAPHVPWESTRECFEAQDPSRFTLEKTPSNASPLPPGSLRDEPGIELSEARQREGQKGYYAAVTFMDQQVGRLLKALEDMKLTENTVVIFTSDHGYHLGWRGQWCKHSIDEQVLRVPLLVRQPGAPKAARAEGIVELLDLFPSFCEFARIPVPPHLDGRSFVPLVRNPDAEGKNAAYCRWGNGRTVRTKRWRFVERDDGSRELYDHNADPAEYFNVAGVPENAAVVSQLHQLLEAELGPMVQGARKHREKPRPDSNQ